jgi:hypothetical protein
MEYPGHFTRHARLGEADYGRFNEWRQRQSERQQETQREKGKETKSAQTDGREHGHPPVRGAWQWGVS